METWLVMPDETEQKFLEWRETHPDIVHLDTVTQFTGHKVYAVTITDKSIPPERKKKHLSDVPHAHEPGATAGAMDFANALITGKHLDGRPFELDRERVLKEVLVALIPLANPDGRSRAPVKWWDGSRYSNEEFWCWMRGKDKKTGKMWLRLDEWSTRDYPDHPEPVGIVYEQVSEHEYVEPNRSNRSSLLKLTHMLLERHGFDQMLALHQTEFPKSEHNCMVILPILQNELPPPIRDYNAEWAEEVIEAWRRVGGNPVPEAKPLGYKGEQREYLLRIWGEMSRKIPRLTSEVQNNNPRTPPEMQLRLTEVALRTSIQRLLK